MKLLLLLLAISLLPSFKIEPFTYWMGCAKIYHKEGRVKTETTVPRLIRANTREQAERIFASKIYELERFYNGKAKRNHDDYQVWQVTPQMILTK
jgi:hypothetical protein